MKHYQPGDEYEPNVIESLTGGWKNWAWLGVLAGILFFNYANPAGMNPIAPHARTDGILTQAQADWLTLFNATALTPILFFVIGMVFMASTITRRWKMIRKEEGLA